MKPSPAYPFATIKPNSGFGHVKIECVDKYFEKQCNPRTGFCTNHLSSSILNHFNNGHDDNGKTLRNRDSKDYRINPAIYI